MTTEDEARAESEFLEVLIQTYPVSDQIMATESAMALLLGMVYEQREWVAQGKSWMRYIYDTAIAMLPSDDEVALAIVLGAAHDIEKVHRR